MSLLLLAGKSDQPAGSKTGALSRKPRDDQLEAVFQGVCEWEGMQLENELADGSWLMFELSPDAWIFPKTRRQVPNHENMSRCFSLRSCNNSGSNFVDNLLLESCQSWLYIFYICWPDIPLFMHCLWTFLSKIWSKQVRVRSVRKNKKEDLRTLFNIISYSITSNTISLTYK